MTSRIMVYFDDLLSVFNDAQLKSALNTYKEITQLMKRASEQKKRIAGDKLTVSKVCSLSFYFNPQKNKKNAII